MKKVMLVDDDADMRAAMKMALETEYEVVEAGSKAEGMEVIVNEKPDLVFLDVMMETDTAGFEMARAIRQTAEIKDTRIIMLTGVDSEKNMDFKSEAGDSTWLPVDHYVEKPVDFETLTQTVEEILNK